MKRSLNLLHRKISVKLEKLCKKNCFRTEEIDQRQRTNNSELDSASLSMSMFTHDDLDSLSAKISPSSIPYSLLSLMELK